MSHAAKRTLTEAESSSFVKSGDAVFAVPRPPKKRRAASSVSRSSSSEDSCKSTTAAKTPWRVEWFGASNKGKKARMEDKRIEIGDLSRVSSDKWFAAHKCCLFGIFDGHGGVNVCSYLEAELPKALCKEIVSQLTAASSVPLPHEETDDSEMMSQFSAPMSETHDASSSETLSLSKEKMTDAIHRAMRLTFKKLDALILQSMAATKLEGSTATLCLIVDRSLVFTANVGDSKAILVRKTLADPNVDDASHFAELSKKKVHKATDSLLSTATIGGLTVTRTLQFTALQLTVDDTVLDINEVKRIEKKGGVVANGRVNGVLEVTRSFGDSELKRCGVSATPHFSHFRTDRKRDLFLVVACDGLWSVFSALDCAAFVCDKLQHKARYSTRDISQQLVADCVLNKNAKDNVSAIIVRFAATFD